MWYAASITTPAASEPVTVSEVKAQCRIDTSDDDTLLSRLISGARDYVERYCNCRFASQTVTVKCDSFSDMARFVEAPVTSITSIKYYDTDGNEQTLSTDVYELRSDGMESAIALKYGQVWPTAQAGTRITVVAVVGFTTVPPAVKDAILLLVSDRYENRQSTQIDDFSTVDALLSNYRRGW